MKLQLSIWAEKLNVLGLGGPPDPFAVVTILRKGQGAKPDLLGKTEAIERTTSPDWTKLFTIDDYQLGSEMHLAVSLYHGKQTLGSAIFEVGEILGSKGSVKGRELKSGGIVVASLESAHDSGSLRFRLRGLDLPTTESGRIPDAFFELQRLRTSASRGTRVWDAVFRSPPIPQSRNPTWGESYVAISSLCGSNKDQMFRLAVYDFEENGNHEFMGDVKINLDGLVRAVTPDGEAGKALALKKSGADSGSILVIAADVTLPEPTTEAEIEVEPFSIGDDEEFFMASPSEEITMSTRDLNVAIAPTFANFVKGGCELHVMVAIDATASNGDPRQPGTLHYFDPEGKNCYQTALSVICKILSKYDSDQKYPVYGFGAKRDGKLSHCFNLAGDGVVSGVDGILAAYDKAFKSGMVMSSPRDFSEIIATCSKKSLEELETGHAYSILLLFTNGAPANASQTVKTFQEESNDAPLSTVIIGIGEGDFTAMSSLVDEANQIRDKVRFVQYATIQSNRDDLSSAGLDHVPGQLENYFQERHIYPNPEKEPEDIVITPFSAAMDIDVPVKIQDSGQPVVTGEINQEAVAAAAAAAAGSSGGEQQKTSKPEGGLKGSLMMVADQGRNFLSRHKKEVGNLRRKVTNEAKKQIKKRYPQAKFLL